MTIWVKFFGAAGQGRAWPGVAWLGWAGRGEARPGLAWQGNANRLAHDTGRNFSE
jgi:hypothetical protein